MSTRNISVNGQYYKFNLYANGANYRDHELLSESHAYSFSMTEQLNADIFVNTENIIPKSRVTVVNGVAVATRWTESTQSQRKAWTAYSLSDSNKGWQKANAKGTSHEDGIALLKERLIKRIAGDLVDPTMYIKEIDSNFNMVSKRVEQGYEFLKNLRNPRKLARLTARYFAGTSRKELTARYRRARTKFLLRSGRHRTRDWSSAYLEYQFGWKPLMEDTVNLVKLAKTVADRVRPRSVRVTYYDESRYDFAGGPISSDYAVNRYVVEDTGGGHARLWYAVENPALRALATMTLPVYSLWDSIPFSFLADMATNIGDRLKYLGYNWGLRLLSTMSYYSTFRNLYCSLDIRESRVYASPEGTVPNTVKSYMSVGPIYRRTITSKRQKITSWPALPWVDRSTHTVHNAGILITLGALIHQWISSHLNQKLWDYTI